MAKISSVNNGESGSSARGKINTAIASVEVNAAEFSGDGNVGTALNLVDAGVKASYEANADTNAFTDAEKTKLAGIEAGATGDQSNAEIKTAYEANADTNAFTDAEQTKLGNINQGLATTDSPSFAGLAVDSATLVVDSVNSRVGIGTASPMDCLDVESTDNQLARFVSTNGNGRIRISDATDDLFVGTAAGTAFFGPETSATGNNLQMDLTTGAATIPGGLSATLTTAAQPNITSLGTLTSATVSGDLTVDTNTLYVDSATDRVSVNGSPIQNGFGVFDTGGANIRVYRDDATITSGEELGSLQFQGTQGAGLSGASVRAEADENWAAGTNAGGKLIFRTTTNGTVTPTDKVCIDNAGNMGVGVFNPQAKLTVGGGTNSLASGVGFEDGDTGIYEGSANQLRFTFGGNIRMLINSSIFGSTGASNTYYMPHGFTPSAAGPAYSFKDDTDTGIYTDAADTIKLATGGFDRVIIDDSGNVGIGTSTPNSKLSVAGLPTYADDTAAGVGGLVAGDIYKTAAGDLKIKL